MNREKIKIFKSNDEVEIEKEIERAGQNNQCFWLVADNFTNEKNLFIYGPDMLFKEIIDVEKLVAENNKHNQVLNKEEVSFFENASNKPARKVFSLFEEFEEKEENIVEKVVFLIACGVKIEKIFEEIKSKKAQ